MCEIPTLKDPISSTRIGSLSQESVKRIRVRALSSVWLQLELR
jgi:hypothetical protein